MWHILSSIILTYHRTECCQKFSNSGHINYMENIVENCNFQSYNSNLTPWIYLHLNLNIHIKNNSTPPHCTFVKITNPHWPEFSTSHWIINSSLRYPLGWRTVDEFHFGNLYFNNEINSACENLLIAIDSFIPEEEK